jgi:hypothetical protein
VREWSGTGEGGFESSGGETRRRRVDTMAVGISGDFVSVNGEGEGSAGGS